MAERPLRAYDGDEPYIFVTYSHEDTDLVYPEIRWLQDQSCNVWYDEGISAGKVWRTEIAEAIQGASKVLFYISRASLASDHCNREIDYALNRSLEILPVYLDETELTAELDLALSRVQALHRDQDASYRHHLIRALGPTAADQQTDVIRKKRLWPLYVTPALVGVALATGGWWYQQATSSTANPPLTAVAVLPFDDLSPDGDQAWLANGMAVTLIGNLSRIDALRVPAQRSTQLMKAQNANITTIGEKLRVGSIVQGSVQRSGDALQVAVQLIDVVEGDHLWSARYDRKLDDVFEIQREISREIAEAIRVELSVEVEEVDDWGFDRFGRYMPQDVRAYELVMKGAEAASQDGWGKEALLKRLPYYEKAVEIDSTYAAAHAAVGLAYVNLAMASDPARRPESLARARAALKRALKLDPQNASAHFTVARMARLEFDWEKSLSAYQRAVELYPTNPAGLSAYGVTLATVGRVEEAFVQMQRAVEFEAFWGTWAAMLGSLYYFKRDYETALQLFDRAIERQPVFASISWLSIANSYHERGMATEALQAALRGFPAEAELSLRRGNEAEGWEGALRAALDFRLVQSELRCPEPRTDVMVLSAMLGDQDRMFDCLESLSPPYLWVPLFDSYRDDPRFHALLQRWKLEDVSMMK